VFVKTLFYRIGICVFLSRATFVELKFGRDAIWVKRHASFLLENVSPSGEVENPSAQIGKQNNIVFSP